MMENNPDADRVIIGCKLGGHWSIGKVMRSVPDMDKRIQSSPPRDLRGQQRVEICDGPSQSLIKSHPRFPIDFFPGEGNIRLPLDRIVLG